GQAPLNPPGQPPTPRSVGGRKIPVFLCPSDYSDNGTTGVQGVPGAGTWGVSNYVFNARMFAIGTGAGGTRYPEGIRDGTSKTIMYAERLSVCNRTGVTGQPDLHGGSMWAFAPYQIPGQATWQPINANNTTNYGPSFAHSSHAGIGGFA